MHGGNPYVDTPSEFSADPAYEYAGAAWRETTSVYGPAFTLLSGARRARLRARPPPRRPGSSRCSPRLACSRARCWPRGSRATGPLRPRWSAGTRSSRSTSPAAATTTRCWRRSSLGALALAAAGRRSLAGAAWAGAILLKWIPAVFFALRAVEARATGRRVDHRGFAVAAVVARWRSRPGATASTGCARSARSRETPRGRRATRSRTGSSSSAFPTQPRSLWRRSRWSPASRGSRGKRCAAARGSGSRRACCSRRRRGSRPGTRSGRCRSRPPRTTGARS